LLVKEIGLEANAEEMKYMLLCREKNAGQYHDLKVGNKSFKSVEQFKYLVTTLTNQIVLRECLVSFGTESFIFQFAIQKYKF
jgi:hypothetical protein